MDRRVGPVGVVAWVLVVLGVIGVPLSLAAASARAFVGDKEAVVAAARPLAGDPRFRESVADAVAVHADEAIADALGFAIPGGRRLIRAVVGDVVASDWFATTWERSVGVIHSQLRQTVTAEPDALFTLGGAGQVNLQLGPAVAAVRDALVTQGVAAARLIPDVDATLPVAQSELLARLPGWLRTLDVLAWALPAATAALLGAAAALPGNRRARLAGIGIGVAAAAGLAWLVLRWFRDELVVRAGRWATSTTIADMFQTVTAGLRTGLIVAALAGAALAAVAWLVRPAGRRD